MPQLWRKSPKQRPIAERPSETVAARKACTEWARLEHARAHSELLRGCGAPRHDADEATLRSLAGLRLAGPPGAVDQPAPSRLSPLGDVLVAPGPAFSWPHGVGFYTNDDVANEVEAYERRNTRLRWHGQYAIIRKRLVAPEVACHERGRHFGALTPYVAETGGAKLRCTSRARSRLTHCFLQ